MKHPLPRPRGQSLLCVMLARIALPLSEHRVPCFTDLEVPAKRVTSPAPLGGKASQGPQGGSLTELKLRRGGDDPLATDLVGDGVPYGYLAHQEENDFLSRTKQFWPPLQTAANQTPSLGPVSRRMWCPLHLELAGCNEF